MGASSTRDLRGNWGEGLYLSDSTACTGD
jgi:hypothetical protein